LEINGALMLPAPLPLNSTAAQLSASLAAALGLTVADAGVEVEGAAEDGGWLKWRLAASRSKVCRKGLRCCGCMTISCEAAI
jgi:hypothetical protein